MNIPNPVPAPSREDDDEEMQDTLIRSLPPKSDDVTQEYDILSASEIPRNQQEQSRENELMHASFMSSMNSTIRIEINDEDRGSGMSAMAASAILRKCKQQVFRPYSKLLLFISWRPYGRERFNYHCGWKTLNLVYPVFIVAILFYTYIYELLACQGKLDIDHDETPMSNVVTGMPWSSTFNPNKTTTGAANTISVATTEASKPSGVFSNCNHVFTSYIIPDLLHLMAFCVGFWYFRIQDNEQMYALIEQVFLLVTPLPRGIQTQTDMIRSIRRILLIGALWIFATLGVQGLFLGAYGFDDFSVQVPNIPLVLNIVLLCVDVFGSLVVNSINMAVVVNFGVQCETIIIYAQSIQEQLLEKSARLQNIMHDLYRVWQAILRLNGPMSKMTSLCAFYFAERFVIGLCLLFLNKHHHALIWVYRSIFPIMWLLILSFPIIQALRVNRTLEQLKESSMEVRVFGYQNSPVEELDSFQQFIANGKTPVKLMGIPVRTSSVYGSVILTIFILIILMQTGVLTGESIFF